MKKVAFVISGILLCCGLARCQNNKKDMKNDEKYQWDPGASAPAIYPMEFSKLNFMYADGDGVGLPGKSVGTTG